MNRNLIAASLFAALLPATTWAGPADGFRPANNACPTGLPAVTVSIKAQMSTCRKASWLVEPGTSPVFNQSTYWSCMATSGWTWVGKAEGRAWREVCEASLAQHTTTAQEMPSHEAKQPDELRRSGAAHETPQEDSTSTL